jgi:uncharacterized repeat protein (TIGR01451 family)
MKNYLLSTFATLLFFTLSTGVAFAGTTAATNCKPIYGGGQSCAPTAGISIDKKVLHPISNRAVDNLTVNDVRFRPGQDIRFVITVTNTGATVLSNIELTDELPAFIVFTGGSVQYRQENNVLRSTIAQLKPNESAVFDVRGKIVDTSLLPVDQGTFCSTNYRGALNKAYVVIADKRSDDASGFCIQKEVTVTTVIPETTKGGQPIYQAPKSEKSPDTGPEIFGLIGLIPSAAAGLFLRNKSK